MDRVADADTCFEPASGDAKQRHSGLGGHSAKALLSGILIANVTSVTPENSSDLSLGRRPMSKSVEFSGVTCLVVELQ
jgi:hypothetical protein